MCFVKLTYQGGESIRAWTNSADGLFMAQQMQRLNDMNLNGGNGRTFSHCKYTEFRSLIVCVSNRIKSAVSQRQGLSRVLLFLCCICMLLWASSNLSPRFTSQRFACQLTALTMFDITTYWLFMKYKKSKSARK